MNQIQNLPSSGVLNNGQSNSLTVKLTHAIDKLNLGDRNTARNELNAFVNEVNAYVNARILTRAQADQILGGPLGINSIIASILR
jgi:hypothetical protein